MQNFTRHKSGPYAKSFLCYYFLSTDFKNITARTKNLEVLETNSYQQNPSKVSKIETDHVFISICFRNWFEYQHFSFKVSITENTRYLKCRQNFRIITYIDQFLKSFIFKILFCVLQCKKRQKFSCNFFFFFFFFTQTYKTINNS